MPSDLKSNKSDPTGTPKFASTLTLRASSVARVHTVLAFAAFVSALVIGCAAHYRKIVKNDVAGYPEEWFPSVSATIGDWYPERNIFQILIALTSGPRFALVYLQYHLSRNSTSSLPFALLIIGTIRTLSCGGWVYITSSDDHDVHDVLMITYIVCNIPWIIGGVYATPSSNVVSKKRRKLVASMFFGSLVPMIYYFIQHKVNRIPGAYTRYAFFEWSLIFMDILYDAISETDFKNSGLEISLTTGLPHEDYVLVNPKSSIAPAITIEDDEVVYDVKTKRENVKEFVAYPYQSLFSFSSDVYLAFVSWSIFTSLAPTLFYFSIWELGIDGNELALLSVLSPIVLCIFPLREWVSTQSGRAALHVAGFAGLVAYKVEDPGVRLMFVGFGTACTCIRMAVDWSGAVGRSPRYHGALFGLGLIISSLLKHLNYSNNPIWPGVDENSGGYNKTGVLLALIAILNFATRNERPTISKKDKSPEVSSWFLSAIPLGSLIFSLHCFLADSGTLVSWTWTGYPIKGPLPHFHGPLTILAQVIGLSIAFQFPSLIRHHVWYLFGCGSAYVLYAYNDWTGYAGGLCFATFLMSSVLHIGSNVYEPRQVWKTYFTASVVYVLFILANVWTVAYAFVPGGKHLRERSDIVLAAQMITMLPAYWPLSSGISLREHIRIPAIPYKAQLESGMALLCIITLASTFVVTPSHVIMPYRSEEHIIRTGIWTMHFGIDNGGRDSQLKMQQLISDMELDVVGLLETDLHRIVFGNRDLTRLILSKMGYYVDIGPGPNLHTWGAVLLSKFPIIRSSHHLLPSPHGELAPAISAILDVWGTQVHVIVAHNGQEEDPLDRELQTREISRLFAETYPMPAIFLGYLITKPHNPAPWPYGILTEEGKMFDIDDEDLDRWCEYIMYRGLYRTSYARLSRGSVTDTELQIGQFYVPPRGTVLNETRPARYLRRRKEELPVSHWFPMEYYGTEDGGGVNGHFYHVFYTPLYYAIPGSSQSA